MASKLVIACPDSCSVHPDKIGADKADALLRIRESGAGAPTFVRLAKPILGYELAGGTVTRHLKHYRAADEEPAGVADPDSSVDVGNIEILKAIVKRGYANSRNWKPTIKDTLDAMRLLVQITGNTGDDEFLALLDSADEPVEAAEALGTPDEQVTETEELPEPAL